MQLFLFSSRVASWCVVCIAMTNAAPVQAQSQLRTYVGAVAGVSSGGVGSFPCATEGPTLDTG